MSMAERYFGSVPLQRLGAGQPLLWDRSDSVTGLYCRTIHARRVLFNPPAQYKQSSNPTVTPATLEL